MVSPGLYYAVENGVWFTAARLAGPWRVAVSVPAVVYAIPPSSPLHYVTYVRVYYATPDVVYVGYTAGYVGTCVSAGVGAPATWVISRACLLNILLPSAASGPIPFRMSRASLSTSLISWKLLRDA